MPSPLSVILANFRLPLVMNNGNKSAAGLFIKRFNQNNNTTQNSSKEIITQYIILFLWHEEEDDIRYKATDASLHFSEGRKLTT